MRTGFLLSLSLLLIGADFALATVACRRPPEDVAGAPRYPGLPEPGTRVWDAALGIDIRCKKGRTVDCAEGDGVGPPDCVQGVYWHEWQPVAPQRRHLDRNSHIPQDGKLQKLPGRVADARYTCDHVVELNMMKQVMEAPGGVCDQAHERYTASRNANEKKKIVDALISLRAISFNQKNLHFFDRQVEGQKTLTVQNPALLLTLDYYRMSELNDFINGAGPGSRAGLVAKQMDRDLEKTFKRGMFTVDAVWSAYALAVKGAYDIAVAKAKKTVQRDKECHANGVPNPPPPRAKRAITVQRMVRRHRAARSELLGGVHSSLTRRVPRSAPRAGPNAPKAACCPKKNEQPKTVVPKTLAPTRPKPATHPRQPATRPAPRAPSAEKRRVARPANRALRPVGKESRPTPITPKRKPKIVPKSTRRPRGTARPRRRR